MEFDIEQTHPDYDANRESWELMRDAQAGESAIKAAGEKYLPMKSAVKDLQQSNRPQADHMYELYKVRAEFPDVVGPTIRGLVGHIHNKPSVIELPTALDHMIESATSDGLTLEQLHQRITTQLLRDGRYGLLPGIDDSGMMHIAQYGALTVTNWDGDDYVILNETANRRDPATNKWDEVAAYRECLLEEGRFVSRVWTKDANTQKYIPGEDEAAVTPGGQALDFVPFVFVGSDDLSPSIDDMPMTGLARLAVRAYRLDADYMHTLHLTSEPTPYIIGDLTEDQKPGVIGAAQAWLLPQDSSVGFLEFTGAGASAQAGAIRSTQERAVMFGAQMFAQGKTAESGDALRLRQGGERSILVSIAKGSAAGLQRALENAAIWAGANPDEVSVEPNLDFVDRDLTPQEIDALVRSWQSGAFSRLTLFENLQAGGVVSADRSFEDEEELIAQGSLGGLDDADGE